jgi:glycosyltransferase involved in cell wall biosynthesis
MGGNINPFFSVIVPTYNRADKIKKTIDSVRNQNFDDWELIIIDDGSTDNTNEVLEPILYEETRIKYFFQKNQERSIARNNGIIKSKGEYICFLDSDDEYLNNHLSILHSEIERKNKPKALFFTSINVYNNDNLIEFPVKRLSKNDNIFNYIFSESIYPCRVSIHNSVLNDFHFPYYTNMGEDTILWLEIASKFPIYQINEKTVNYYQHDGNSVNKRFNPNLKIIKGFKNFKKNNTSVYNKVSKKLKQKKYSELYYGVTVSYIINSERFLSIYYIFISLIYDLKRKKRHKFLLIYKLISFQKMNDILKIIG